MSPKFHEPKFVLSPFRWPLEIFFFLALLSNGFMMVGFSPVASIIATTYDCPKIIVDL